MKKLNVNCWKLSPNMRLRFECFNSFFLFIGVLNLCSCLEYKEQYACIDYYHIKNSGDSMIITSFITDIWTGNLEKDTTILLLDDGQFKLDDETLLFSTKTDTSFLRKPVNYLEIGEKLYCMDEQKQVIDINREDGLNYSTLQTYYPEDNGKHSKRNYVIEKDRIENNTWKLANSTTFFYDDNYIIVKILRDGAWMFPAQLCNSSDEYILENKDTICCIKDGKDMTIVFCQQQQGGSIKKDSLQLHHLNGEYMDENNNLFLSSERDTTYMGCKKDDSDKLFQLVIDHNHTNNKERFNYFYSIYWDDLNGNNKTNKYITVPIGIIKDFGVSEIIYMNNSCSFLYDSDYNISNR